MRKSIILTSSASVAAVTAAGVLAARTVLTDDSGQRKPSRIIIGGIPIDTAPYHETMIERGVVIDGAIREVRVSTTPWDQAEARRWRALNMLRGLRRGPLARFIPEVSHHPSTGTLLDTMVVGPGTGSGARRG